MKKILFLSSAFIMTTLGVYAADGIITGGAGTCTVDVLGVSDNNATANTIAVWSINEYTLAPGEYLNVTETSVDKTTCPAGSYCVGGAGFTVDNAATSIAQCPAEYPNSAEGAGADTQCYTACTVATANIAHATAVAGNDYFGDGVDTCTPTGCETGYHVDGGGIELVEKTPLVPISLTDAGIKLGYINTDGSWHNHVTDYNLTSNNTWAVEHSEGVVYGKASCQPQTNPSMEYIMANFDPVASGDMTIEEFKTGLEPLAGTAKTEYVAGIITDVMSGAKSEAEMAKALSGVFSIETDSNYSTDSVGQNCYCQMNGFTPTGETKQIVISAPWTIIINFDSTGSCATQCAWSCAGTLYFDDEELLILRAAVVGALGYTETAGICAANTINIDWNPDNGGEHTKNMCTYDGEITLPTPDPVKPGYTFTGWKLVE